MLERLAKSGEFRKWKQGHKGYFLAHFFKINEKGADSPWQIGYCNPESNSIASFSVAEEKAVFEDESKPFHKPGSKIDELKPEDIGIDYDVALEKAESVRKSKYKEESILKSFMILQSIEKKPMYNITFFTASFRSLNIKLSSKDGSVISDQLIDFLKFS